MIAPKLTLAGVLVIVAVVAFKIVQENSLNLERQAVVKVRLAKIEEESRHYAERRKREAERQAAEAVAKFPERRDVIIGSLENFNRALNEGDRETMAREFEALRMMLEPVLASDIADRPDVMAFRAPYERVKDLVELQGAAVWLPSVGDTWDEALPKLNTGTRLSFRFVGPDQTEEIRRFRDGRTYRFTFERSPERPLFVLMRIQQQ